MEEKKIAKEVKMKPAQDNEKKQRLSYDELNDVCMQLSQQNQVLRRNLQQMDMTNMFKRLDYLFMVLKYESVIKDSDFVNSCVEEIKQAISVDNGPLEETNKNQS